MSRKTQYLASFLVAVVGLWLVAGCASTGGGGSYQLKQTRDDVDWGMVRYHNRLSFGFITSGEQDQVNAAYKAYQTAFNQAAAEAHFNYTAPTPDNVKQLANQLTTILGSIP
jgi:hypothetical protein